MAIKSAVKLKSDGRKMSHEQSEYIRIQAVKAVRINGSSPEEVIKTFGLHRANIYKWLKKYDKEGLDGLKSTRAKGPQAKETLGGSMIMGLGKALGEGVGGVLISAGIQGVANLASIVGENNLHTKFLESLANAIQSNRIIKEANKDRVRQYAETIFKFAPNVATDPNLLSSILANAIHGEGIDPMTIKTLTDLESRYKENTTFSPKSYT